MHYLIFFGGVFVGVFLGIMAVGMLTAAKESDAYREGFNDGASSVDTLADRVIYEP